MPAPSSRPPLPVVLSPVAGDGRAGRREQWLRRRLSDHFAVTIYAPTNLEALQRDVAAALGTGASVLAVVGGDGTLHHVVNALAGSDVTLVPIPAGSGNDFCRGVGLGTDPEAAIRALLGGRTRAVDLIEVNGTRVCTVAGIGLVATSALRTGRLLAPGSVWRPLLRPTGPVAYLATAGVYILASPVIAHRATLRWRAANGTWHTDDGRLHGVFLCALPTLGAGLRLPIRSATDDGLFEVAILPETRRARLLRYLPRLRWGQPVPRDLLVVHRTDAVSIKWPHGTEVLGDGEPLGRATAMDVRVLPGALRVTAP